MDQKGKDFLETYHFERPPFPIEAARYEGDEWLQELLDKGVGRIFSPLRILPRIRGAVRDGKVVVIAGEHGSGRTTLLYGFRSSWRHDHAHREEPILLSSQQVDASISKVETYVGEYRALQWLGDLLQANVSELRNIALPSLRNCDLWLGELGRVLVTKTKSSGIVLIDEPNGQETLFEEIIGELIPKLTQPSEHKHKVCLVIVTSNLEFNSDNITRVSIAWTPGGLENLIGNRLMWSRKGQFNGRFIRLSQIGEKWVRKKWLTKDKVDEKKIVEAHLFNRDYQGFYSVRELMATLAGLFTDFANLHNIDRSRESHFGGEPMNLVLKRRLQEYETALRLWKTQHNRVAHVEDKFTHEPNPEIRQAYKRQAEEEKTVLAERETELQRLGSEIAGKRGGKKGLNRLYKELEKELEGQIPEGFASSLRPEEDRIWSHMVAAIGMVFAFSLVVVMFALVTNLDVLLLFVLGFVLLTIFIVVGAFVLVTARILPPEMFERIGTQVLEFYNLHIGSLIRGLSENIGRLFRSRRGEAEEEEEEVVDNS